MESTTSATHNETKVLHSASVHCAQHNQCVQAHRNAGQRIVQPDRVPERANEPCTRSVGPAGQAARIIWSILTARKVVKIEQHRQGVRVVEAVGIVVIVFPVPLCARWACNNMINHPGSRHRGLILPRNQKGHCTFKYSRVLGSVPLTLNG